MSNKKRSPIKANKYPALLRLLKKDIRESRLRAAIAVTIELSRLYWHIGNLLSEEGLENEIIDRLSNVLKKDYGNELGFSSQNLQFMCQFTKSYPDLHLAEDVLQLPWEHNLILLEKLNNLEQRLWYAKESHKQGWGKEELKTKIESKLFQKKYSRSKEAGRKNNKTQISPDPDRHEIIKDIIRIKAAAKKKKNQK